MNRKILAICGSLGRESSNLRLLQTAISLAPNTLEIIHFDGLRHLPLFDPDTVTIKPLPQPVQLWKEALGACDAILIASPEYGHSLPGGLKNGIDWIIGSGELYSKPVVITAAVIRPEQGLLGLSALRQTLEAAGAMVMSDSTIIQDNRFDEKIAELLSLLAEGLDFFGTS